MHRNQTHTFLNTHGYPSFEKAGYAVNSVISDVVFKIIVSFTFCLSHSPIQINENYVQECITLLLVAVEIAL